MAKEKKERYSGDLDSGGTPPRIETVQVMFRENRKFDLRVGRETITFRGKEKKSIPEKWLKTRDWAQQSSKFVVWKD
jgi:hypothetical protein